RRHRRRRRARGQQPARRRVHGHRDGGRSPGAASDVRAARPPGSRAASRAGGADRGAVPRTPRPPGPRPPAPRAPLDRRPPRRPGRGGLVAEPGRASRAVTGAGGRATVLAPPGTALVGFSGEWELHGGEPEPQIVRTTAGVPAAVTLRRP